MLPAVEIENRRPAVVPAVATSWMRSRTETGATIAKSTLGIPNSAIAASTGSARGPGSQRTIASSTGSSMIGISSTATAPSPITDSSSQSAGKRSASRPPAQ
jgi:hypothetical protein